MTVEIWTYLAAGMALIGLVAYAILAGADFGGGVWDLFATGPRKAAQRETITHAMGPVWEANHVWLIFVVVFLFTCFPRGYAAMVTALFVPFHLALFGIMLRGAAFVFRGYGRQRPTLPGEYLHAPAWSVVFRVASVITPFLLGAAFGALTSGDIRVTDDVVELARPLPWLTGYAIGCGLLALSTCAYLAAVYLCAETTGALRDDFRTRAIIAGTSTAALSGFVLLLAYNEAGWFFRRLLSAQSAPVIAAGLVFFGLSAWAVFGRRYALARVCAAAEIVLLLCGWALAHQPYLLYPDLTLRDSVGPLATVEFMVVSVPLGLLVILPSLVFLFRVFKTGAPAKG
jgi:cytochrome d ubiquinol oxidase subunit II